MKRLLTILAAFFTVLLAGALVAGCGGGIPVTHLGGSSAKISVDIPKSWVVQDQKTLVAQNLIPKGLPFVAAAAASGIPTNVVFQVTKQPWLLVSVQPYPVGNPNGTNTPLTPAQLYLIIPADLQQNGFTSFSVIKAAYNVKDGGFTGSAVAATAAGPAGSESFYEVVYTNAKHTDTWIVVAGCSAGCYTKNKATITAIVDSVKVGTAA